MGMTVEAGALLALKQVGERLSVNDETVRCLVHRGELEAVRVGRLIRVREEALCEFIQRNTINGTPNR